MSGARELTPEEVAALGLPPEGPGASRELTAEELKTLGLPLNPGGDIGEIEAAALGAGQGATLGFSDEAAAAMDWLAGKLGVGNPLATRLGEPETYKEFREYYRRRLAEAQRQNPKSYGAGRLAGAVAVPGSGLTATVAQGAAAGVGESEADLTKGEVGGALADAGIGGVTGAVGFGAGKLLSKGVEKAAPALKRALRAYSIEKGRQALLGGSKQLAQETPIRPEAIEDALRADSRFSRAPIGILGSSAGAAKRLRARADAKQIVNDEILGTLEDAGVRSLPSSEIARRLAEAGEEASQNTGIAGVGRAYRTAARDILSKKSEEFAPGATLGLRQGEKIKSSYQEIARSGYKQRQPPSVPKANMNVARIIREANEEAVDRATQEAPAGSVVREMGEAFVPVKRSLRNTLEALEAAEAGAYRASTRTSDAGSKALSAMAHGVAPTKAAIVGALQELYQGRGASTIAAIANRLGRGTAIDTAGDVAGDYLPAVARGILPQEDIEAAKRRALIEYLRGGQ